MSLQEAVKSLLEIGKRDLSNPKYESYFNSLQEELNKCTSQPLQPRCPKCGALMLGMGSKVCSMVASCSGQEHHNFDMRCWNDFAQFFSAPPAMPALQTQQQKAMPSPRCAMKLCGGWESHPIHHNKAMGNYHPFLAPASPQLEQVAREIYLETEGFTPFGKQHFKSTKADEIEIAKVLEILQRYFPVGEKVE